MPLMMLRRLIDTFDEEGPDDGPWLTGWLGHRNPELLDVVPATA